MAWQMVMNVARQTTARLEDPTPIYEAKELTQGGDLARIKL